MIQLNVFGQYELVSDKNTHSFQTAWPVMIVAYILVEYNNKIIRNKLYDVFYPMKPLHPEEFHPASRVIYEQLWNDNNSLNKRLLEAKNDNRIRVIKIPLTQSQIQFAPEGISSAHQQLKDCGFIKNVELKEDTFFYTLSKKLCIHIDSCHNDSAGRKRQIDSIIWQHVDTIKKHFSNDKNVICSNGEFLIINFDSNATALEEALANNDYEKIKKIYQGPFLDNIENKLRADVWISPILYFWLQNKRRYFAEKVANVFISILNDTKLSDEQRLILTEEIQIFCQSRRLDNQALVSAIQKIQTPLILKSEQTAQLDNQSFQEIKSELTPPFVEETILNETKHLECICNHLLNKTADHCESQLKFIKKDWIDVHLSVVKLGFDTEYTFLLQSKQFFHFLKDKCYGLAMLLGEAGVGKSFALCSIAKQLVAQIEEKDEQLVPLIFNFADWTVPSFESWLKYELIELGLPEISIEHDFQLLLQSKRIVLLLDGFDNIPTIQRVLAFRTINNFIQKYGEINLSLIIASRIEEYFFVKNLFLSECKILHFYAEITIKTLERAESRSYLQKHFPPLQLDNLFKIQTIEQFLNTPLSLTLFIDNRVDLSIPKHSTQETFRANLITTYVEKRLGEAEKLYQEKKEKLPYTKQQVMTWLGQIACSISMGETFYVEKLSPQSPALGNTLQYYYRWWFTILFGIIFGLIYGSIGGLLFGEQLPQIINKGIPTMLFPNVGIEQLPDTVKQLHLTLSKWVNQSDRFVDKVYVVIIYALFGTVASLIISLTAMIIFKRINMSFFLGGYLALFLGTTGWIVDGWRWSLYVIVVYGSLGVAIGLFLNQDSTDPLKINLTKRVQLNYLFFVKQASKSVKCWLLIPFSMFMMWEFSRLIIPHLSSSQALFEGFIIGFSFSIGCVLYHVKNQSDWQIFIFLPSQKIKYTIKKIGQIFIITGISVTSFVTILSSFQLGWPGNLSIGLRVGFPIALILSFIFCGGTEILKHITLRWMMYRHGIAPWHYNAFLEYARQLTLLKPQSNGYAFRHDWFQEYFRNQRTK